MLVRHQACAGCTGLDNTPIPWTETSVVSPATSGPTPAGVPVATFAIGEAGAANAGLFAVSILAVTDADLARKLAAFREQQTQAARTMTLPPESAPPAR